jgi:hypothetical protein
MAKRDKREVRFSTLKTFYKLYGSEQLGNTPEENLERANANVKFSGAVLFESEVEKFAEKNPEIDTADFVEFCKNTGAYKKAGSKSDGSGKSTTRLNTAEAAVERGVQPQFVNDYIAGVNQLYVTAKALNDLMPSNIARVSLAIPVKHEKVVKTD